MYKIKTICQKWLAHSRALFGVLLLLVTVLGAGLMQVNAAAGTPAILNYQARLTNAVGSPITSATNMRFAIYDAVSAGTCVWSGWGTGTNGCTAPNASSVSVTPVSGVFAIGLGDTTVSSQNALQTDIFNDDSRYLEVQIFNGSSWETLSPRKRISSSAYSFNSNRLNGLLSSSAGPASAIVVATDTGGRITVGGGATVTGGAVTLTGNAASAVTTSSGALTITSAAATSWGTTLGNLNIYSAGSGTGSIIIGSGTASATPDLLVLDIKNNNATDPTGTAGAMYYNSSSGKFRCYQGAAWTDCIGAGGSSSMQSAYAGGPTIITASTTNISFVLASGDFAVSGAGSVDLTPTSASSFTSGGSLTFTAGATSTWSTSVGNLTVDSAGVLNLGTTNAAGVSIAQNGTTTTINGNVAIASANGRIFGITGLSSGHTVSFQYGGDAENSIDNTYGGPAQFRAYHGTRFYTSGSTEVARLGTSSGSANSYFLGNVGVGDTTPASLLTVGNGDLFQINSSGSIIALPSIETSSALTITAGGASTWSTSSGDLTLGAGSGNLILATGTNLRLADKGSTGDPATCSAGDIYFNGTDNVFKGCTANNTWVSLSQNDNVNITSETSSDTINNTNKNLGINVSITPRSETSEVLLNGYVDIIGTGSSNINVTIQVRRGTLVSSPLVTTVICGFSDPVHSSCAWTAVDSPSTTSAITYSVWAQGTGSTSGSATHKSNMAMEVNLGADLAEIYSTNDESIVMGDVVALDPNMDTGVAKTNSTYDLNILGVVSTQPNVVMGGGGYTGVKAIPVALKGRVPVKVSTENGVILPGDYLTSSSLSGVAMKATKAGMVIGQAMTGYDDAGTGAVGVVTVYLKNTYLPSDAYIKPVANVEIDATNNNSVIDLNNIDTIGSLETGISQNLTNIITTTLTANGNFGMAGFSIVDTLSIRGTNDRWLIDENGLITITKKIDNKDISLYGLTGANAEVVLSGSAKLEAGHARVDFSKEQKSVMAQGGVFRVNVTATDSSNGMYVSHKDTNGFDVVESNIGKSGAAFDWMVISRRAGYESANDFGIVPEETAPVPLEPIVIAPEVVPVDTESETNPEPEVVVEALVEEESVDPVPEVVVEQVPVIESTPEPVTEAVTVQEIEATPEIPESIETVTTP